MNRLVVKTTNLKSRTCMNTGFKLLYLSIYKGKVFIGSFGCRNDCMAVHFNCQNQGSSFKWNELPCDVIYQFLWIPQLTPILNHHAGLNKQKLLLKQYTEIYRFH